MSFMVGNGPDCQPVADNVSAAWVAFSRSRNLNHKRLPSWKPFNTHERPTMVLGRACALINDAHGEERRVLKAIRDRAGDCP